MSFTSLLTFQRPCHRHQSLLVMVTSSLSTRKSSYNAVNDFLSDSKQYQSTIIFPLSELLQSKSARSCLVQSLLMLSLR